MRAWSKRRYSLKVLRLPLRPPNFRRFYAVFPAEKRSM